MSNLPLFNVSLNEKNIYRRDFLLKRINNYCNPKDSSILEIGIGNGRYGFLLAEYFKLYCGIDKLKEYVELAKKKVPEGANIKYKVGLGSEIPFNRKFDIILYANVWHYLIKQDKAMKEAKQVLSDNGIILISEPTEDIKWVSSELNKNSPDFDQEKYQNKINKIKRGKEFLLKQDYFEIKEYLIDSKLKFEFYLLTQKRLK